MCLKSKKVALELGKTAMIAVMVVFASAANAQSKQKVAVYITGDANAGYKKVIGAKMVSAITQDENYAAVERTADFLAELSKEQDYQRAGAVADHDIAELGRQFGVRFVCVADISKVFESLFISARMINVETGLITATSESSKEINGMEDLVEVSEDVASGLLNNVSRGNVKGRLAKCKCEISPQDYGPFYTEKDLYEFNVPDGWRISTSEEMLCIINAGVKLKFPQYSEVYKSHKVYSSINRTVYDVKSKVFNSSTSGSTDFHQDYDSEGGYITQLSSPGYMRLIKIQ
jgi:TolB-like protein